MNIVKGLRARIIRYLKIYPWSTAYQVAHGLSEEARVGSISSILRKMLDFPTPPVICSTYPSRFKGRRYALPGTVDTPELQGGPGGAAR